jgi:hypothetical protein
MTFSEYYKTLNENFGDLRSLTGLFYSLPEDVHFGALLPFALECLEHILPEYQSHLSEEARDLINQTIQQVREQRFSPVLYQQLVSHDEFGGVFLSITYACSRLLYSLRTDKDWRNYLGQFFDEVHHDLKMPLEKIMELFKKHIDYYMRREFNLIFKPEWKTNTVVSLGRGYLNNVSTVSNNDYLDKLNDALQDEGVDNMEIIENLHNHNRLFGIWIGLNVL